MNPNELIDSNEAAEMDAVNIYVVEQPSVGQQVVTALIAVAVPLVAGFGFVAVVTAVDKGRNAIQNRRARKAAAKADRKVVVIPTDENE